VNKKIFLVVFLVLYFNEDFCSFSPKINLSKRSNYDDDERIRYILRLVDKFGLKELQDISENYPNRNRFSNSNSNLTRGKSTKGGRFELTELGRFSAADFTKAHKEKCRLDEAQMEKKAKELQGIPTEQAIIQYRCKLNK